MKTLRLTVLTTVVALIFTPQVYAASKDASHGAANHSTQQSHDMHTRHGDHDSGMKIHSAVRDGYTMEYRLINMKEKIKTMENMPQMEDTHHLMVFVKDPQGAIVDSAKVGYLIQEEGSGKTQKKMAMAMNNGFGADVTLVPDGHYRIKTKVMAGEKTLMDEFKYMGGDH